MFELQYIPGSLDFDGILFFDDVTGQNCGSDWQKSFCQIPYLIERQGSLSPEVLEQRGKELLEEAIEESRYLP